MILEGKAIRCDENHNLHVRLPGGITGIIPYSECTDDNVRKVAGNRRNFPGGETVCFKVAEINCDTVTLSRKFAQRECMDNCISFYEPGDIIDAVVTHMEPFRRFL